LKGVTVEPNSRRQGLARLFMDYIENLTEKYFIFLKLEIKVIMWTCLLDKVILLLSNFMKLSVFD